MHTLKNSLRTRLKLLTKPFHDELEEGSPMGKIVTNEISRAEYIDILNVFYEINSSFEALFESHAENFLSFSLDINKRKKTVLLRQDLNSLGVEVVRTAKIGGSFETAIGAMYVLEGSTMGGIQLYKAIEQNEELKGFGSYFNPYGENTMNYWQEFVSFLDRAQQGVDNNDVILSACNMFLRISAKIKAI